MGQSVDLVDGRGCGRSSKIKDRRACHLFLSAVTFHCESGQKQKSPTHQHIDSNGKCFLPSSPHNKNPKHPPTPTVKRSSTTYLYHLPLPPPSTNTCHHTPINNQITSQHHHHVHQKSQPLHHLHLPLPQDTRRKAVCQEGRHCSLPPLGVVVYQRASQ